MAPCRRDHPAGERGARAGRARQAQQQIAYALGASERTVKAHCHSIMPKLHTQSLAELVLIAERLGILATPGAAEIT
jgi:hypothetical protein